MTTIQEEFTVEDCRVCINVKDWADRVHRATLEKRKQTLVECPPDAAALGRAAWTFLHTMSVYYPHSPSASQQADMHILLSAISKLYPCGHCAEHMRSQLHKDPPQVSSRSALAGWMCRLHNEVNRRLGKEVFDCGKVFERWKEGPNDGQCEATDL